MVVAPVSTQHRGYVSVADGAPRSITKQGDAGWGIATREPAWVSWRPVWKEDKHGVSRLRWEGTKASAT